MSASCYLQTLSKFLSNITFPESKTKGDNLNVHRTEGIMTGKAIAIIVALTLLSICIGCSNGTPSSLTTPVEAMHSAGSIQSHQLWGLWQFVADPGAATLDAIPLRSSEMHVNVLPFLEPPPLLHLSLDYLEFDGNLIDAHIGLRHPFLGLVEFTGFDVCGILISNGSVTGFTDPDIRMAGVDRALKHYGFQKKSQEHCIQRLIEFLKAFHRFPQHSIQIGLALFL